MQKDTKNTIKIAYACNDGYIVPLCTSIKSLTENISLKTNLEIYILHDKTRLSLKNQKVISKIFNKKNCSINFICVDNCIFNNLTIPQGYWWSEEIFYRLALASLIKNSDKILYLDCDTILLGDLDEFLNTNIDDYYIAAVEDSNYIESSKRLKIEEYYNSGVILFNLKKIREDKVEPKFFDFVQKNQEILICPDQDVLNVVLAGNIKRISDIWNTQQYTLDYIDCKSSNIKIFHYTGNLKPWNAEYTYKNKINFFKYFNKLPLLFRIKYYYYPLRNQLLKTYRKKLIWYYKSEKTLILFNKFKIRLNKFR